MANKGKGKNTAESFGEMFKEFGEAMTKIFNDPEFKKKAREFGKSAVDSAKLLGDRFKDEEVKAKFKDFGKAAQEFGKSVSNYFNDEKEKGEAEDNNTTESKKKKNDWEKKLDKKMDESGEKAEKAGAGIEHHFKKTRWGRVTGYGFSIFWSAVFLILFNYYNQYIAYYNYSKTTETWIKYSFLTEDFSNCLPIITVALTISIIGNILLIIYDKYFFRQIIHMVLDLFSLAAVITLLTLFPFDFSVFPNTDLTGILTPIITVVLILIAVGLGIGIIVRFVKLVIGIAKCS